MFSLDDLLEMRRRENQRRAAEEAAEAAEEADMAEFNAFRDAERLKEQQEDARVSQNLATFAAALRGMNAAAQVPKMQGLLRTKRAVAQYRRRR